MTGDLAYPLIWSNVQAKRDKALRKFDTVRLVSWAEEWAADAIVAQAGGGKAVLAKPVIYSFPDRFDRLLEDDKYTVAWNGAGYHVTRKSDSQVMTHTVPTATMAERDLRALYPRPIE